MSDGLWHIVVTATHEGFGLGEPDGLRYLSSFTYPEKPSREKLYQDFMIAESEVICLGRKKLPHSAIEDWQVVWLSGLPESHGPVWRPVGCKPSQVSWYAAGKLLQSEQTS